MRTKVHMAKPPEVPTTDRSESVRNKYRPGGLAVLRPTGMVTCRSRLARTYSDSQNDWRSHSMLHALLKISYAQLT